MTKPQICLCSNETKAIFLPCLFFHKFSHWSLFAVHFIYHSQCTNVAAVNKHTPTVSASDIFNLYLNVNEDLQSFLFFFF